MEKKRMDEESLFDQITHGSYEPKTYRPQTEKDIAPEAEESTSEKKYRLIVENANEGIVIIQDNMLALVNPKVIEFSGYTHEELTSRPVTAFIHPDENEMVIRQHQKSLQGLENPEVLNFRILNKNGEIRWIENNSVLIEWEGRPATLNFLTDITNRKQAEIALQESEEKYRQLFENESDAIMIFDANNLQFEDANPATLKLFGYSKDEFLALNAEDISDEKAKTKVAVEKVKGGFPESNKVPLRYFKRKDESIFPGEISAATFFSGGRTKIIGTVRDITQRIQAEEKIHALTHELIKAQENERHRIARHLHDQVAQDLSSLKIGWQTLFDHQQDVRPEVKKKILKLSRILDGSISAVRNLSYDLRPPGMDQLGLVRTALKYCDDFSETESIKVDFHSAGMDDLKRDFDTEINLFRLIQEGLNNIKKHADAAQVKIRLVASSPNIILRIEDNGKGFDVESRLAKSLKEKRMGLSSMEERVGLLGGTMRIKSEISKGTKIVIEVPYAERSNNG
jgi:PAS domain S-box-containing protein